MNKMLIATALLATIANAPVHALTYQVTTVFHEPDTQPKDTVFVGQFDYDIQTRTLSQLQGVLSESMTGSDAGNMNWLVLSHPLLTWYDSGLGGTFAAVFRNSDTLTFWTGTGADGWSPAAGIAVGGVHAGFPRAANNPGNAYALIFVPDDPLAALTAAQINHLAYADCAPGGLMGAVCMTGTTLAAYGAVGTMNGYPVAQTITAAVPEPATVATMLAGLGLMGLVLRRRRHV